MKSRGFSIFSTIFCTERFKLGGKIYRQYIENRTEMKVDAALHSTPLKFRLFFRVSAGEYLNFQAMIISEIQFYGRYLSNTRVCLIFKMAASYQRYIASWSDWSDSV